jgi:hypothetical protein
MIVCTRESWLFRGVRRLGAADLFELAAQPSELGVELGLHREPVRARWCGRRRKGVE